MSRLSILVITGAALLLAFNLGAGCDPGTLQNQLADSAGAAGTDSTGGTTNGNYVADHGASGGNTTSGGADTNTGANDSTTAKADAAFSALSEPVIADESLFDDSATAPTFDPVLETALNQTLASAGVTDESITADVQVAQVPSAATRPGLITEIGRLAAIFSSSVGTPEDPNLASQFRGVWVDRQYKRLGTIAGRYDEIPAGQLPPAFVRGGRFQGRFFDNNGQFQGIIVGRWGKTAEGVGFFRGEWRDANDELLGVLKGFWRFNADGGGVFAGRWAAFNLCDETDTLPQPAAPPTGFDGETATSGDLADSATYDTEARPVLTEPDVAVVDNTLCLDRTKPYGFIRGAYRPFDPNSPADPEFDGLVRCLWRDEAGEVVGALIGRWEHTAVPADTAGPQVLGRFVGRYVDANGNFVAFVRGQYGRSYHGLGVFRGEYFDTNGVALGWLAGRWRVAPAIPGGPVFGLWNAYAQ